MRRSILIATMLLCGALDTGAESPSRGSSQETLTITADGVFFDGQALIPRSTTPVELAEVVGSGPKYHGESGYWRGPGSYTSYRFDSEGIDADFDTDSNTLWRLSISLRSNSQESVNFPSKPFSGTIRIGNVALRPGDLRDSFYAAAKRAGLSTLAVAKDDVNFGVTVKGWDVYFGFRNSKRLYGIVMHSHFDWSMDAEVPTTTFEESSWPPVVVLEAGLESGDAPLRFDREYSGESGFSLDGPVFRKAESLNPEEWFGTIESLWIKSDSRRQSAPLHP